MRFLRRFTARLGNSVTSRREDERMREEIEEHLALQTVENLRAGLPPDEARRQATLKFGAVEAMKEAYQAERRMLFIDALLQDLKYTLRQLRRSPGFTLTSIITLALGIGATTAIFTLVHAVLLKSLPVTQPDELWRIGKKVHCCNWGGYTQWGEFSLFNDELYRRFKDNTPAFAELAAFQGGSTGLGVRRAGSSQPGGDTQQPVCLGEFLCDLWRGSLDGPPAEPVRRPRGSPAGGSAQLPRVEGEVQFRSVHSGLGVHVQQHLVHNRRRGHTGFFWSRPARLGHARNLDTAFHRTAHR